MKSAAVHPHEDTETGAPARRALRHVTGAPDMGVLRDERLHALRDALRAARQGDFSVRLRTDGAGDGAMGEVALAFNAFIEQNDALVREFSRVERSVGFEGKTTERASI